MRQSNEKNQEAIEDKYQKIIKAIKYCAPKPNETLIYRGQNIDKKYVTPSLLREMYPSKTASIPIDDQAVKKQQDFISKAKEINSNYSDVEALARLRHYEAPSLLVDFTYDINIALWFACQDLTEEAKKELQKETGAPFWESKKGEAGQLFVLKITDASRIKEKSLDEIFQSFGEEKFKWWKASSQLDARMNHQKSVFVLPKKEETLKGKPLDKTTKANEKGTLFSIKIAYEDKKALREYLETLYGLTARFMYPDVVGEAQAQRQALDIRRIILPYDQAVERELGNCFLKTKNTEDRNTAKLESILVDRGRIKSQLKLFKESIEDCDQAIRLNPDNAFTYHFRGIAKDSLGMFKEAIQDYNEAIARNPKNAFTYHFRGIAKDSLGMFKEAIQDYNEAIARNPDNATTGS